LPQFFKPLKQFRTFNDSLPLTKSGKKYISHIREKLIVLWLVSAIYLYWPK